MQWRGILDNPGAMEGVVMHPIEELRYLILAAQREGSRSLTEALRPLGLTDSQAEVLRVLAEHQPLSLGQLGQRLVCETGSPSRLVRRLVDAGLVQQRRSETDERKLMLTLTAKGAAAADQVAAVEAGFYAAIAAVFDEASAAQLAEAIWRFVADRPAGKALALRKQPVVDRE
ncbi:MAG: MarR family winged helix-turn-helix transcriptional regulator [Sulfobacillus sp.]